MKAMQVNVIPSPVVGINNSRRALFLDVFRIFLCSGIVFYHYTPERPACGAYMVNGFFVMSGFLLALAFARMPQLDVQRFYASKALRLLPIYFAGILMGAGLKCIRAWYAGDLTLNALLPEYTVDQWVNLSLPRLASSFDSPLWFVTVELELLLAAPLLYVLFKNRVGFCVFFLLMLGTAGFLYSQVPYMADRGAGLYYSPLCRCWQLLGGMLSAAVYLAVKKKAFPCWCRYLVAMVTVILVSLFLGGAYMTMSLKQYEDLHCWNFTYGFDVLTVSVFMVLIPLLHRLPNIGGSYLQKMVTTAALLTYPVYVVHVLAGSTMQSLHQGVCGSLGLTFIISIGLLMAQNFIEHRVKR